MIWYGRIFLQALAVMALSMTTLLSGPIARYSTRVTETTILTTVNGLLASRFDNSMPWSQVAWNLTMSSLDRAEFPSDQLLDYIPNDADSWVYKPEQWNNSWSLDCVETEQTFVTIELTDNCTTFTSKFGTAIRREVFPKGVYSDDYYYDPADYYSNSTWIKDALISLYAANYTDYDENSDTYRTIDMAFASLHVHGVPMNDSSLHDACRFGQGPTESASYTRVDCVVKHTNASVQDWSRVAYPDCGDVSAIPSSLTGNYVPRFKEESMGDRNITVISPRDIIRFYQTYMITKDTQQVSPIQRQMSVKVPAVQVATPFVVIIALLVLLIGLGGMAYTLFLLWYRKSAGQIPQSKLDWLLHSSLTTSTPSTDPDVRNSAMTTLQHDNPAQRRLFRRSQFEAATYSRNAITAMPARDVQTIYVGPSKDISTSPVS